MIDQQTVKRMGEVLLKKRLELLERLQLNEQTWSGLREQQAEFEENAAVEALRARIGGLDEQTMEELMRVQKALQKIELNQYGVCELCGQEISKKRLEAVPEAERCLTCASAGKPVFGEGPENAG